MSSQLTLQLDETLPEKYRCLRDVIATGIYGRGLVRVAGLIDVAPSNLSAALADDGRHLSVDQFERYLIRCNDLTPVDYLIARFRGANEAQVAAARDAAIERKLAELMQLMAAKAPTTAKGRR